jgi:hypothetical protein
MRRVMVALAILVAVAIAVTVGERIRATRRVSSATSAGQHVPSTTGQARAGASVPVTMPEPMQAAKPRVTWSETEMGRSERALFDEWVMRFHLSPAQEEQVMIALSDAVANTETAMHTYLREVWAPVGAPLGQEALDEGWHNAFLGNEVVPDLLGQIQLVTSKEAADDFLQRFGANIVPLLQYALVPIRTPDAG